MDANNREEFLNLYKMAIVKIYDNDKITSEEQEAFLLFIQHNFKMFTTENQLINNANVIEYVTKFIRLMSVTNITSQIDVTLHDIVDKIKSTTSMTNYCISEKIFMAILLAIKILRSNYPYDLVFKFSTSAIGKSKLQDSSFRCSGGKEIASRDPVGSNFFELEPEYIFPLEYNSSDDHDIGIGSYGSYEDPIPLNGGQKSRRRHRRHRIFKSKSKTHRRRRNSRIRKHKKHTSHIR